MGDFKCNLEKNVHSNQYFLQVHRMSRNFEKSRVYVFPKFTRIFGAIFIIPRLCKHNGA